jgi:hypothetical protein
MGTRKGGHDSGQREGLQDSLNSFVFPLNGRSSTMEARWRAQHAFTGYSSMFGAVRSLPFTRTRAGSAFYAARLQKSLGDVALAHS